ncbi:MAG: MBL fold metallo-hydrolase [Nitrososphaerales archaeon]
MQETTNVVEVSPGIFQIRLPIPIKPLGSVFVYLVRSKDHNILVDTGWDTEESYTDLKTGLEVIGVPISRIDKIIISHLHPDHYGLSSRLKKEVPNASVIMHRSDAFAIRESAEKYAIFIKRMNDWAQAHGVPERELKALMESSVPMLKFVAPARPDIEVIGGEVIRAGDAAFVVISTPGHTIGNICLYERTGSEVLFSGDHILPTITPNVSLSPLYSGDPLGDYLRSLEQLRTLKVSKILPSHEFVFTGLDKRIEDIKEHHKARLKDTLNALNGEKEGISGFKVASKLHWYTGSWEKLSPWEKRAALMETLAHLEYLKREAKVAEIEILTHGESKILYSLIASC